jgi:glutamate/tyrosine decarboxylase-like PLP-dependent enzyme
MCARVFEDQAAILEQAARQAIRFLEEIDERSAFQQPEILPAAALPEKGPGAAAALEFFTTHFEPLISASAGPRYLAFVTGGSTPAAVAADWLVSAYDQNASHARGSCACAVELQALDLLRQLVGLPAGFEGCMVTGATMANFCGLGAARQWCGEQQGIDIAQSGLSAAPPIAVFAATPHASAIKALAMLGMGRAAHHAVQCLPGREAMHIPALREALANHSGPSIVLASACTVNTADFDDLSAAAELCREFGAWLHVDAAFGLFAACSSRHIHLLKDLDRADSISADAHKWLNVPYDCGFMFTRHLGLLERTFHASAAYLGANADDLFRRTPESSRRFRALPVWMTLMAYGRDGYREIVERTCALAESLGEWIKASPHFELLAPVRLNIVCFALRRATTDANQCLLRNIEAAGRIFLTPTHYAGKPALRAAFSNWRTTAADLEIIQAALQAALPSPS